MISKEEEKAIDYLQFCYDISTIEKESLPKLGIALNLIDKLQKELDKKDKIIDLMAEEITYMDYIGKRPSKKHIKEKFYKKVEEEND